jgi:hypothetical protein
MTPIFRGFLVESDVRDALNSPQPSRHDRHVERPFDTMRAKKTAMSA